ncbi:MAG: hypothetical protein K2P94_14920 [Rhodospirillaceae bacterium]|nr:hypothetical protein [Rhodospirillaceae bacterium]
MSAFRFAALCRATLYTGLIAACALASPAQAESKTLGFIAWDFIYASYDGGKDACPDGLNRSARDWFLDDQTPEERARLSKPENEREVNQKMGKRGTLNACSNPTEFKNYGLKLFQSKKHYGFNLDGKGTTTAATAAPNTCAHENFTSAATGEPGIDNQLGRVVGCIRGYREGFDLDKYSVATLATGEHSILIEIRGVDDTQNDPEVEIGLYSGKDPVTVDAGNKILPYQSFTVHDDKRFHNVVRGKIVDGEVVSENFDLHLKVDQQVIHSEFDIKAARVKLKLNPDGSLKGMLGGYFDVARRYEHIMHSGVVTSWLLSYNCPGVYEALHKLADGYPDPKTGKCTAISTAFRVQAVPAFVIHPATQTAKAGK